MPKVDKEKCAGCGLCAEECPADAISMQEGKAVIDQDKCIKCGKCIEVCPMDAIKKGK